MGYAFYKGTLTIFYVRRVLRYGKIVPDKKKKLAFSFFYFFSSDMVLSTPVTVSFLSHVQLTWLKQVKEIETRMPIEIKNQSSRNMPDMSGRVLLMSGKGL